MTTSRRQIFKLSAAALAGAGVAACGGSEAAHDNKAAFVLVHGAWHGAWAFSKLIPELAALGHTAVAVDLPGHGLNAQFPASWFTRPLDAAVFATQPSPVAGVTQDQYTDATMAAIDQLRAGGHTKIVLLGHSLGGLTVTAVAEKAPEKLKSIVYLSALMLDAGKTVFDVAALPQNATGEVLGLVMADGAVTGALRIDPASTTPAYLAAAKSAFYGDVTDAQFRAIANMLTPDEPLLPNVTPTVKTLARWGSVPRHYISLLQDRATPLPLQQLMIANADTFAPANKTVVHTMNTSHSPFFSAPKDLAAILAKTAA